MMNTMACRCPKVENLIQVLVPLQEAASAKHQCEFVPFMHRAGGTQQGQDASGEERPKLLGLDLIQP
jgi:hypothetical protein